MSQPRTKAATRKQRPKKTAVIIAAAVAAVILAVVGYIAYDSYLDQQDKQRFETVKASVKQLHERLQAAAGPGVEWGMHAVCREGGAKFQEALKGCSVGTETSIEVKNTRQAKALIKQYKPILDSAGNFERQENYESKPIDFPDDLADGLSSAVFREKKTSMGCSSTFNIDDRFDQKAKAGVKERNLEINFYCNDRARELYYLEK